MKYVSTDTETTGLDKEICSIIEIGAIIEDTDYPGRTFEQMPKFECIVEQPSYHGGAFAINMNQRIFKILAGIETAEDKDAYRKEHKIIKHYEVADAFFGFLIKNGFGTPKKEYLTKEDELWVKAYYEDNKGNFPKIEAVKKFYKTPITINVAGKNFARFDWDFLYKLPKFSSLINFSQRVLDPGVFFTDWKEDKRVANSNECKSRAGLTGETSHKAIEDAWDVVQILRKGTNNYAKNF